jgi:hypothetical protein
MNLFTVEQFNELAQQSGKLCVSIYSPTERQSTDAYRASKLHFKNALTEVRNKLVEQRGMSQADAEEFLADGFRLLDDQSFRQYASDLLAYFIVDGEVTTLKLPLAIETPQTHTGERLYLLPLIPELNHDGHFYVLALNLKEVALFEVTRSTIQAVDLPDEIYVSYTEDIEEYENQKQLQHRSGFGQAGAIFHGQGSGSDEERKERILQFFHRLSSDLDPLLHQNPLPLVLAGVEYLIPIYKQASNYPYTVDEHLIGSYSAGDMLSLSAEAWELMEPHFRQQRQNRKDEYGLFMSRGQGDSDPESVITTALSGGVDTLFVQPGTDIWGTYDAENFTLTIDGEATPDNYSLTDEAAKKTKEFGGTVYLVDEEAMPASGALIAGIFRYPVTETVGEEAVTNS